MGSRSASYYGPIGDTQRTAGFGALQPMAEGFAAGSDLAGVPQEPV